MMDMNNAFLTELGLEKKHHEFVMLIDRMTIAGRIPSPDRLGELRLIIEDCDPLQNRDFVEGAGRKARMLAMQIATWINTWTV